MIKKTLMRVYNRRLLFGAHQLLEDLRTSEHVEHILKKLINYMDDDVHVAATALHRAESDSVPMLLALKGAQVDINKRDANERTPLMSAALAGNVEAVIWLMQQQLAGHQDRDIDGNSALHLAAMSEAPSSVEVMAKLLREGAHQSPHNRTRSVPLHRLKLCQADYPICRRKIALLLEAGADVDARDKLERTPLMDALLVQNTNVVRALIDAGAPIDSVDCFGVGALHEAALRCAADTLRELSRHEPFCRAGVDVLAADSGGHSPWDCFAYSLQVPTESVSRLGHTSEDRCRAFEDFYVQVRDFQVQSDIDALARVRAMLRANDDDGASRELSALAAQKEPRELWATGVVMQTLRSINLLIRQGDADAAGEGVEERMVLLREEQGKSPWAYESIWWSERPSEIGPSEECWQRQADLAKQMRQAGLERWNKAFMEDLEISSGGSDWDTVDEDSA